MSVCNCIADIEAKLSDHSLDVSLAVRGQSMNFETYTALLRKDNGRRESRSKQPRLIAHSFCPFCGVSLKGDVK